MSSRVPHIGASHVGARPPCLTSSASELDDADGPARVDVRHIRCEALDIMQRQAPDLLVMQRACGAPVFL